MRKPRDSEGESCFCLERSLGISVMKGKRGRREEGGVTGEKREIKKSRRNRD